MPLIDCPDCHKPHSDAAPACIHCGRPNSLAVAIVAPAPTLVVPITPGPPPGGLGCPRCASADVRKLSLVWREGQSVVNSRTTGVGIGGGGLGVGGARNRGTSQTLLSMGAEPPKRKSYLGWILAMFIFPPMLPIAVAGSAPALSPLLWLGGMAAVGYFMYLTMQWNGKVWPQLVKRWENTFLCTRCGERFVYEL